MCYESIAIAFPETKKKYPWFPDNPKLFLSALGVGNAHLLSFSFWIEKHMPVLLGPMKLFSELSTITKEELFDVVHSNFAMIVVHVWIIDYIFDKLKEENLYPSVRIGLRNKMHKLLNDAIEVVVQADSKWLGEHADWWVPSEYAKRRVAHQWRNKK